MFTNKTNLQCFGKDDAIVVLVYFLLVGFVLARCSNISLSPFKIQPPRLSSLALCIGQHEADDHGTLIYSISVFCGALFKRGPLNPYCSINYFGFLCPAAEFELALPLGENNSRLPPRVVVPPASTGLIAAHSRILGYEIYFLVSPVDSNAPPIIP